MFTVPLDRTPRVTLRRRTLLRGVAACAGAVAAMLAADGRAGAQTAAASPVPAATPLPAANAAPAPAVAPAPTATPRRLGFGQTTSATATFIDQSTAGEGKIAAEAPGFIGGSPLSPNTPYDLFSSAPQTPGVTGLGEIASTLTYGFPSLDLAVTAGLGYVRGSGTNAAYWGESLMPTQNPHLGSQALPYGIVFPAHAGEDDATSARLSILGGSLATADGRVRVRGGWFDLAQSERFVFVEPPLTNVNPAIAYGPAESLSSGLAGTASWQPYATALPLHGIDAVARSGDASLELTNAALPSLPGESARMTMGSLVFDRGEGTRLTAQLLHVTTSGAPFTTTVPFGTGPQFVLYPQGVLPTSTLSGQRETIAGVRAAFHLAPALSLDAVTEIGRSWYDAAPVARPGTQAPGGFYHVALIKAQGRATATLDLLRMEPRYATVILPYGVAENQWSAAFSWPGQWLKSNYQLVDNSALGVNRQGYRVRYYVDGGPLETHFEYTDLHQIERETLDTSTQAGFIDGYYLPQPNDAATFGRQKRYAAWLAWHPAFGSITLDVVDDTLYRPARADRPQDRVSYEVPQAVLTFSRPLSSSALAAVGLGRYAMKGTFAEPIDFAERLFFAGLQVRESARTALLVTFRRSAFGGKTTFPQSPRAPDFTDSTLIVEQRVKL